MYYVGTCDDHGRMDRFSHAGDAAPGETGSPPAAGPDAARAVTARKLIAINFSSAGAGTDGAVRRPVAA